jgi:hypothetical protein
MDIAGLGIHEVAVDLTVIAKPNIPVGGHLMAARYRYVSSGLKSLRVNVGVGAVWILDADRSAWSGNDELRLNISRGHGKCQPQNQNGPGILHVFC